MTDDKVNAAIMVAQGKLNRQHANMAQGVAGTFMKTGPGLSAKTALIEAIAYKRMQLDQLEALARAIPDNFPADADAGLWQLVNIVRRS